MISYISSMLALTYAHSGCLRGVKCQIKIHCVMLCFDNFSGTMKAACDLMEVAKATVLGCIVIIELVDLKGRGKLKHELLSFIK